MAKWSHIIIILVVLGAGGYVVVQSQVAQATADAMESLEIVDLGFEDFSLFPPSATLVLVCQVENPSTLPLTVSFDLDFFAGDDYITSLVADEEDIRAGGKSIMRIEMSLGSSAINILSNLGSNAEYSFSGTFTATATIVSIPVTVVRNFDSFEIS